MLLLSLSLANTIAEPVRRLADAAETIAEVLGGRTPGGGSAGA